MTSKLTFFLFLLFIFYSTTKSQENQDSVNISKSHDIYKVSMKDGSVYQGKIVKQNDKEIELEIEELGKFIISRENIEEIIKLKPERFKKGEYWFDNPNATRYFITPTGFNLQKGEGYYQNTYILFNSFYVGITDFLSLGGGFEAFSTLLGHPIYFVIPKIGFQITDNFNAGLGVLYVDILVDDYSGGFGLTYGVLTYGSRDNNLSAGIGYSIAGDNDMKKPIVTLSGMYRIRKNLAFVTDNCFFSENSYTTMFSYGIRFFKETFTLDLGFLNNKYIAGPLILGIPYADIVLRF